MELFWVVVNSCLSWSVNANFWTVFVQAMVPWWRWYYYINPIAWTLYAIIVTQLGDDTHVVCTSSSCTTMGNYAPLLLVQLCAIGLSDVYRKPAVGCQMQKHYD